jgi:glycogen synthase
MSNSKKSKSSAKAGNVEKAERRLYDTYLFEIAWEVCNQVGGIYTVLRSKVPTVQEKWGENYFLVGPYFPQTASVEFEPIEPEDNEVGRTVRKMREKGFEVYYGHWLVTGRPRVVLLNPFSIFHNIGQIKYYLWENHGISTGEDNLVDQVIAFGDLVSQFFLMLADEENIKGNTIAHFHEWMAGTPIPNMRMERLPIHIIFTTHATMLGRYLAMNDSRFYDHLAYADWFKEARHFNIEPAVRIERAAAHGAHIFTTVSEVTAKECRQLLGREPEFILPNGINIQRFIALHEFQNLHLEYKEKIHQFVMGHFFQSYHFELDKTLYFFTSGRYEYRNKGFDLTLEALARLNWWLKQAKSDITVVCFFITKQPYQSINPDVLQSRAVMEEIRQTCDSITKQVGNKLFYAAAGSEDQRLPQLNDFVDDYWRLRLRRTLQSWKSNKLPSVVTHNLWNDSGDDILNFLRSSNLINKPDDKVKVVYHPDFISPTNPLFGMEYGQFVRGCHLGVFPSYYEPWGYTPLECIARGVPAVTSDLSGFGDYVLKTMANHEENGIYVVRRDKKSFDEAAHQLTQVLFNFVQQTRRDRITQRNKVESSSPAFDWKRLIDYYEKAYSNMREMISL